MKQTKLILFITVLFLLSCSLPAPAATVPAATQPAVVDPPQVSTEALLVTPPPTVEQIPPTIVPTPENNFGQIARAHMEALTAIGARYPGTANERLAAQYIMETFTKLGYSPQKKIFAAWDEDDYEFQSANVWAIKQGDSPQEIIIGAHYDSGNESLGADDNASGVGVLLEVAEQIADLETPYTIRFIAFGSEENDLDGSYFYVARMSQAEVDNTLAMINLDTLASGDFTYVYSDEGEDAFLRDWVLEWAGINSTSLQTIPNVDLTDDGYVADYGAFKDRGIPYIYFEATNWTLGDQDGYTQVDPQYGDNGHIWHTQYDNLEYIDTTFPGRVDEHLKIFVSALVAIFTEFQQ
jgi:alkaline phosphatase isozyme conversion protein